VTLLSRRLRITQKFELSQKRTGAIMPVTEVFTMDETIIQALSQNASGAHWAVIVGVVLMLLVQVARAFFGQNLPTAYVALFTAGLAMLSETALLLMNAETPWWQALLNGLVSGATAMGFYSLAGKHIFALVGKAKKKAPPPAEDPPASA